MKRSFGPSLVISAVLFGVFPPAESWAQGAASSRECQVLIDVMKSAPRGDMLSSLPPMARVVGASSFQGIEPQQSWLASQRALLARARSKSPRLPPIDCGAAFKQADLQLAPSDSLTTPEALKPNLSFTRVTFSADGKAALFVYGYWASMMGRGCFGVFAARESDGHWAAVKMIPLCPVA